MPPTLGTCDCGGPLGKPADAVTQPSRTTGWAEAPDPTAVRVALWRAIHAQVDPPPRVLEDEIGLQLAAPGDGWRERPDMDPQGTRGYRASIVARARLIEDPVGERARTASPSMSRSALVSPPSPSAGRGWHPGCSCSRSSGPARRPGSAGA